MAFVVLYDACVLYPAPLRDLLIRLANAGIVQARWSERILDECFENILRNRPDLSPAALRRTRELMCDAVPDCLITGYEPLEGAITLPDPDDRHVVAAALRAGAQVIITFNIADFPPHSLTPFDIETKHPDDFVLESVDIAPGAVVRCVTEQAAALKNPPQTVAQLLDTLGNLGLVRSVARLKELLQGDLTGSDPPG
jgi:predicted nucleic acid-binding protein